MDLLINRFGTRIRRRGGEFLVAARQGNVRKKYAARRIKRILISRPSSISSGAVRLALEQGVDVAYLGAFGKPEARIVSSRPSGLADVRRAQLVISLSDAERLRLAKRFASGKIQNQINFARTIAPEETKTFISMHQALRAAAQAKNPGTLLSAEGRTAEHYFNAWKARFDFRGRDPGGRDRVNAALNYGYGILYNEVERAVLFAGLDPAVGLFHTERYGKPSLVLDMVEEFRVPVVDAVILPLFLCEQFTKSDFTKNFGGFRLSLRGRRKIIKAIFERLNVACLVRGSRVKLGRAIELQVQLLTHDFLDKKTYLPFVAPVSFYAKLLAADARLVADAAHK